MIVIIENDKGDMEKTTKGGNQIISTSPESEISMLDAETIAELKVLENPKFPRYVKKALDDKDFLATIIENSSSDDWLLRWGTSRILVHVCKRKPELMKDSILFLVFRLSTEKKQMVRDNISQCLVHLSKGIPDDFARKGAIETVLKLIEKGRDHERFDAITVIRNIAGTDTEIVNEQIVNIEKIVNENDNPVVTGEAQRTLVLVKDSMSS